MKHALMMFVVQILARQASATVCNSSGPMVVGDTQGATQLADAVNCSDGYFSVDWIGEVTLAGVIEVGDNTTLEIYGAEDGSSYINGSGHSGLFQTTGGTLHLHDLTSANGTRNGTDGGAISALYGAEVQITNCMFVGNNAFRGGAIFGSDATVHLMGHTSFDTNYAMNGGGGIYTWYTSVFFEGSTVFVGNEAGYTGGGAQFSRDVSYAEVSGNISFKGNRAFYGGGLVVDDGTTFVAFGTMIFDSNTAITSGGELYSRRQGETFFSATSCVNFTNNTALNGGAIGMEDSYLYIDGDCIMESNTAISSGGALYCTGSEGVEVKHAKFFSNVAEQNGGAIAITSAGSESSVFVIQDGWFMDNKASDLGGAVYVFGEVIDVNNSIFIANTAERNGGAMAMVSTGTTESAPEIWTCWFENNAGGDSGGAMYVVGEVVCVGNSSFTANTAGHTGGAIRTSGITYINACVFEGNTAYLGTAVFTAITTETEVEASQFENNNLLCDENFFLDLSNGVDYDTACYNCGNCTNCSIEHNTQVQLCAEVLDNTASPSPNGTLATLKLDEGYWRSSESSKNILECYEPSSCVGGSDDYCEAGYSGPFCAVCTDGYARGLGYTCLKCNKERRTVAIGIAAAVLVIILALVAYGFTLLRHGYLQQTRPCRQGLAGSQPRFRMARASQALKIVIVAWQIVTQFSSVASVTYPGLYEKFLAVVDVFNFNLGWIFAAGCIIDMNFYTNLIVATIGPLVIVGLISTSYICTVYKRRESDPAEFTRREYRHGSAVFWISFLIYSSASSAIFRTFACDDLDTGRSYLRVDHSLECYTPEHHAFVGYASVMMMIYPIGIPVCYALLLYGSRKTLKTEREREDDTTSSAVKGLWRPYRPKVYYYEVIECLRRVTLSGVVVFVYPNTAGQVAVTFLLALFFFTVMMILDPYANIWDAWLARLGHGIVIISMFVALLLKVNLSGEEILSQDVFAGVLIAGNCIMILVAVAEAIGTCFVTVRELRHPIAAENIVRQASTAIVIPALDSPGGVDMTASPPPYDVYANDLPGSTGLL